VIKKKYPKVEFIQVEHFAVNSYRKYGILGIEKQPKTTLNSLSKIMSNIRTQTNIEWVILGSKQTDGLSRRLQLKTYEYNAIDWKNNKCYPLSNLKNKDVLRIIKENGLITPLNYGDNRQSQSTDITDIVFLKWVKKNYPSDFNEIKKMFPDVEIIIFRDENK
jgi:hypothetical protein